MVRRRLRFLTATLTAAGVLLASGAFGGAAAAENIGFVAAASGEVGIDRGDSGTWQAARRDTGVAIGDRLRTGLDSSLKVVLVDDTLLQLAEDTELRIETFHVGTAATQERSILRQTRGRLRATVGDAFGGSTRLEVHAPTAAIGVKGTDFEVRKAQEWEACLISGGIVVSNDHGKIEPPPGFCVVLHADEAPGDPFQNPLPPLETGDGGDDFGEPGGDDVAGGGELDPGDPGDPNDPNDPYDPGDPGDPNDPLGDDDDEFEDFDPVLPEIEPEIEVEDPPPIRIN